MIGPCYCQLYVCNHQITIGPWLVHVTAMLYVCNHQITILRWLVHVTAMLYVCNHKITIGPWLIHVTAMLYVCNHQITILPWLVQQQRNFPSSNVNCWQLYISRSVQKSAFHLIRVISCSSSHPWLLPPDQSPPFTWSCPHPLLPRVRAAGVRPCVRLHVHHHRM